MYDAIFVGTSPMCLLEACATRLAGKSVLMVDRATTVGGAWKTHQMFGHDDIENGPHFLLFPDGNDFLREDLGFDLRAVPSPEWLICDDHRPRRLSDGTALLRIGVAGILKSLKFFWLSIRKGKQRDLRTAGRLIRKACHQLRTGSRFFILRPPSQYLRNGSGPLVRALERYARQIGIEFQMGTEIGRVVTREDGHILVEAADQSLVADANEIVLTDHARIETFVFGTREYRPAFEPRIRTQVHFFIKSQKPIDFYLLRFFSDKYFLLSNLSYVYDRAVAADGHQLLTLALLNAEKPQNLSQGEMQAIIADLIRWRILPADTQLGEFVPTFYDDTLIKPKSRREIEEMSAGRVRYFGRLDLSELIAERAPHWRASGLSRLQIASGSFESHRGLAFHQ